MRPKRGSKTAGEFEDPLKNYDTPKFADDLEKSLATDAIKDVMQTRPFVTIPPDFLVEDALKIMVAIEVACLMVTDDAGKLVGILSERDFLVKTSANFERMKRKQVREIMRANPIAAYETDPVAKALNVMAIGGFRHVPILDVDDRVVGILGPRRVVTYIEKHLKSK
jgi:CBS domain-containing protein